MVQYKITSNGVLDTVLGGSIPANPYNRNWREYKEWKAVPNTPDPSIDEVAWFVSQQQAIKKVFEVDLREGFVTSVNYLKFDSGSEDIQNLQMALDLATKMSVGTIDVRDYDNVVHPVTVAELQLIINDLNMNYKALLNQKWVAQDALAVDLAYTNFVNAELAAHNVIVAAN